MMYNFNKSTVLDMIVDKINIREDIHVQSFPYHCGHVMVSFDTLFDIMHLLSLHANKNRNDASHH